MKPFNFECEYCGNQSTITDVDYSKVWSTIRTNNSRHANIGITHISISCPNPSCKELTLMVQLQKSRPNGYDERLPDEDSIIFSRKLLPRSNAKPLPDYIPKEIVSNYTEACLIVSDSPKASASLARRCLQGIVRDFWEIPENRRGNLGAELSFIKQKLKQDTWEAIQTIRSVGDIGAHMEKDVNLIIEVDADEANLLLRLIETLLDDWYVERQKRSNRNAALQQLGNEKLQAKRAAKAATKTE